jgi:hypothetical protein
LSLEVLEAEASIAADRSFITGGGSIWFASVDQRTTLTDEVIKVGKSNVIGIQKFNFSVWVCQL